MKAIKSDLIDQTIHLWRGRSEGAISREDAREMINNVSGFFEVLADWDLNTHSKNHHQSHANGRMRNGKGIR
jgi:hypothetical protein